jgi:serine O-acetyltransferase
MGGRVLFDHLNGDQFATFLYFVANSTWVMTGDAVLATKLFSINKIMHGLDLYFSVSMPETFLLVHPVGSVIGNASYGDYLVVYQNCTIGSDAGKYPRFGEGTILYARSSVLGDCTIGNDVVFAANAFVVNSNIASNSIVVGQYPAHRVLANSRSVRERLFDEQSLDSH